MEKKDYVILVNCSAGPCWFAGTSDEQRPGELVTTANMDLVLHFAVFNEARSELRRLVKAHPMRSFKIDIESQSPRD